MKKVFSTIGETCHAWAHDWRRLGNGRNSTGNVYFQQNVIFSYGDHFPMAAFTEACDGETIVLMTSESYSSSTSRHQSNVASAVSHYKSFCVPILEPNSQADHMENWTYLRGNLNSRRNEIAKSKTLQPHELEWADNAATRCNDYARVFKIAGLESHQFPIEAYTEAERARLMLQIDTDAENRAIRRIEASARDAEAAKVKLETEAIREARQARLEFYERITFGLYKAPRPRWKYGFSNSPARTETRDEKAKMAAAIKAWKRSESGAQFPYSYDGPVLMRLDSDRKNARTSGNAVFPIDDCISIWPLIETAQASKARNDAPDRKLGMYRVDHISESGDVKAGCHSVAFAECRKLAIILELIKPTFAEALAFKARKAFA
mgnify:CR=1 FL=1